MVTIILGQTLVFWSGIAAGISFILLMLTCAYNLGCMAGICSSDRSSWLHRKHKYFVWLAIAATAVHAMLALLSSLFHVWL